MVTKYMVGGEKGLLSQACRDAGKSFGIYDFRLGGIGIGKTDAPEVLTRPMLYGDQQNPLAAMPADQQPLEVIGLSDLSGLSASIGLLRSGAFSGNEQVNRLLKPFITLELNGRHLLERVVPDNQMRRAIASMWSFDRSVNANVQRTSGVAPADTQVAAWRDTILKVAAGDAHLLTQGDSTIEEMATVNERSFGAIAHGVITRYYWENSAERMFSTPGRGGQEGRAVLLFNTVDGSLTLNLIRPINNFHAGSGIANWLGRGANGDDLYGHMPGRRTTDDIHTVTQKMCEVLDAS